jgi:NADH-quinone oxidoreductase subunit C
MTAQQIIDLITSQFGAKITETHVKDKHPRFHCTADNWRDIAEFLYADPRLKLDWLACLSATDYVADQKFCVVYDLVSFDTRHRIAVKVYLPRDKPVLPSVCDLWPAADWHEREAYDMYGLEFTGHPDLRRILCADDWEGFPLRKDYVFPREYHGIPASVELDWQQQPDYPG